MAKFDFIDYLINTARTEEDVKYAYVKQFNLPFSTKDKIDLNTGNVLFEFKYNKNFLNTTILSKIIAQSLYYIRRVKYSGLDISLPGYICVADNNESALLETVKFQCYYDNPSYDWYRAPSDPDKNLVAVLNEDVYLLSSFIYKIIDVNQLGVFTSNLINALALNTVVDTKIITKDNFDKVFDIWNAKIGKYLNKDNLVNYFMSDLQLDTMVPDTKGVITFRLGSAVEDYHIPLNDYKSFWLLWKRPPTASDMELIISRKDRLKHIDKRRFQGEFFTPLEFAKLAIDYMQNSYGNEFWKEYKIWDMACGTGNLEYYLGSYENVYMSTLLQDDVDYLVNNNLFPEATVFQYDYLNDDISLMLGKQDLLDNSLGWKLPRKLREDLANKENKWIVLLNPPFASASNGINKGEKNKKEVTDTYLKSLIDVDLGAAIQELSIQFIYRIMKEFFNIKLCLYSKLKYLLSPNCGKFRDNLFKVNYQQGFIFPSISFNAVTGNFPVSFLVWDCITTAKSLYEQEISVDVYNAKVEKIGLKSFIGLNKESLNYWFEHPKATTLVVPLSSAINVCQSIIRLEKLSDNSIGFLESAANDVFNSAQKVLLVSSAFGTGNGWSIESCSFEKSLITFAVRKLIKATWINDRDQFKVPNKELTEEFINDCVVYALLHGSNQTSALKDIEYKGNSYQVRNQFFPFLIEDIKSWDYTCVGINSQLRIDKDRFVAKWLIDKNLSEESQKVFSLVKDYYKLFFKEWVNLDKAKWKIDYWDAGWYQIRNALKDANLGLDLYKQFQDAYIVLRDKLRPQVYEFGFLDQEIIWNEDSECKI